MNKTTFINGDCLEKMKTIENNSIDIIFTDPPYNLSTKWTIDSNTGKPEVDGKAKDFMTIWQGLDGKFLESLFSEWYRILKHGGRVLMFGMDRQLFPFQYYAALNKFIENQHLYWYYIQSFPKSVDLSKSIDKHLGIEREIVGKTNSGLHRGNISDYSKQNPDSFNPNLTKSNSELGRKYEGMKGSIAPLKQVAEVILVFQKPYLTGSLLHDTLEYEKGNKECLCGALDIENNRIEYTQHDLEEYIPNRVGYKDGIDHKSILSENTTDLYKLGVTKSNIGNEKSMFNLEGRFPSQMFVNDDTAEILDNQSGILTSGGMKSDYNLSKDEDGNIIGNVYNGGYKRLMQDDREPNSGGCSKILEKCNYDNEDYDIFNYNSKASVSDRQIGMNDNEINNHVTVKPLSLLIKILGLFKTPNPQIILDCFSGSGTTGLACKYHNIDCILIEKDEKYFNVGKQRVENYNPIKKDKKQKSKLNKTTIQTVNEENDLFEF